VRAGFWMVLIACAWGLSSACQLITGLDHLAVGDSGVSAAGTAGHADNVDDAGQCPSAGANAECDPVSQCGCPQGQHCQIRGAIPSCVMPGKLQLGEVCSSDADCAAGSGCLDGLCKRYCERDSDCSAGPCRAATNIQPSGARVRGCLTQCDFVKRSGCAPGAQCARLSAGAQPQFAVDGDFCVVPLAECKRDSRCDEPDWGTRVCRAGSDSADCECQPSVAGGECNLADQCGCAPGAHCALDSVSDTQLSAHCIADRTQPKAQGELCNDEAACAAGYSCWRGLCEKYCRGDLDCPDAVCISIHNPEEVGGVRVCSIACNFATEQPCKPGSRCVHAPAGQDYCFIPRAPCPFAGDGSCDESTGTRICVDGSDATDCH
jgi:hypothetical protein